MLSPRCSRPGTRSSSSFIDTAEGVIVAALARGDVNAATFVLRTQGHRRGWSTLAARQEAEQTPEQPRRKVDMTAALKALSPAELMQLEAIVAKLEANAKAEARELDADERDGLTTARADLSDAGTSPGRGLRRSTRSRRSSLPTRSSRPQRLIYRRRIN